MNKITEIKEEKEDLVLKLAKESIATQKSLFFAGHYPYLNKSSMRLVLLISTTIVGAFLAKTSGVLFFFPYIAWIGYDIYRMEDLVKIHNTPIEKRIKEIDKEIAQHEKLKVSIGHTINFLEKFKKTV